MSRAHHRVGESPGIGSHAIFLCGEAQLAHEWGSIFLPLWASRRPRCCAFSRRPLRTIREVPRIPHLWQTHMSRTGRCCAPWVRRQKCTGTAGRMQRQGSKKKCSKTRWQKWQVACLTWKYHPSMLISSSQALWIRQGIRGRSAVRHG